MISINDDYYLNMFKNVGYSFDFFKSIATGGIATRVYEIKNVKRLFKKGSLDVAEVAILKIVDPLVAGLKKYKSGEDINHFNENSTNYDLIYGYACSLNERYNNLSKALSGLILDGWGDYPIVKHYAISKMNNDLTPGGVSHNVWYILMDKAEGTSIIDTDFDSEKSVVKFAYNFASALATIHVGNHCISDLKPSNIYYNQNNNKVTIIDTDGFRERMDFSFSHRMEGMQEDTALILSDRYCSPEGEMGISSPRGDMYSYATVILDLILQLNNYNQPLIPLYHRINEKELKLDDAQISKYRQLFQNKRFFDILYNCLTIFPPKRLSSSCVKNLLADIMNSIEVDDNRIIKEVENSYDEIAKYYRINNKTNDRCSYSEITSEEGKKIIKEDETSQHLNVQSGYCLSIAKNKHLISKCFLVDDDDILRLYFGNDQEVVIPDEIKAVGRRAFAYSQIKKITLTSQLYIDNESFLGCKVLEQIDISRSLKDIKGRSFLACENLKKVCLPRSVVIEKDAFLSCGNLTLFYDEYGEEIKPNDLNFVNRINQKKENYRYLELNDVDIDSSETIISNLLTIDSLVTDDEDFLLMSIKRDIQRIKVLIETHADCKIVDKSISHISAILFGLSDKFKSWFAKQYIAYVKCLYWSLRAKNCAAGGTDVMYSHENIRKGDIEKIERGTVVDFLKLSEQEYLKFLEYFKIPVVEYCGFNVERYLNKEELHFEDDKYFYSYIPKRNPIFVKRLYSEIGNVYYDLSNCELISEADKQYYSELAFSYLDLSLDYLEISLENGLILGRYGKLLEYMFEKNSNEPDVSNKIFETVISIYKKANFNCSVVSGLNNSETVVFLLNCYLRRMHDILSESSDIKIVFDNSIYKKIIYFDEYEKFWENNLNSNNEQELVNIYFDFSKEIYALDDGVDGIVFKLWSSILSLKLKLRQKEEESSYFNYLIKSLLSDYEDNHLYAFFYRLYHSSATNVSNEKQNI